jgi:aconitate hydratase
MLLKVASVIDDPVTTTDELIPSGETSSYRSNPLGLAEFTLSRKDPAYVGRAKAVKKLEDARLAGNTHEEIKAVLSVVGDADTLAASTGISSVVYANRPGDGSAREQAASCQRVLGAGANIAIEYATKRYRSNLIYWGMIPFTFDGEGAKLFANDQYIYIEGIRKAIENGDKTITAKLIDGTAVTEITLNLPALTPTERDIILDGCLINYYNRK